MSEQDKTQLGAERAAAYQQRSLRGLSRRDLKDILLLADFIECYCEGHHEEGRGEFHARPLTAEAALDRVRPILCPACASLMTHAISMRMACPLDPKPACKHCTCQCYSTHYKTEIKKVMRYSGRKKILAGRLDYLWHYFF